jgi:hypothetical protein
MGRAAIRTAVTDYFAEANLELVGKVHSARPTIIDEQSYETNMLNEAVASSATGGSAVLVTNIPSDNRRRRADTGRGAVNDSHIFKVVMEVFFASVGGDALAAQADYDTIIDQMVTLVRANATMNAPSAIWSAGEYETGVDHQQSEPFTDSDGLTIFISGAVSFDAWEWIAGPV